MNKDTNLAFAFMSLLSVAGMGFYIYQSNKDEEDEPVMESLKMNEYSDSESGSEFDSGSESSDSESDVEDLPKKKKTNSNSKKDNSKKGNSKKGKK